jgi:large subunit ribosomal protein L13
MKTFSAKPHEVERAWFVADLNGKTVGRAATEIARILRGKHKPIYTPHNDTGDFVIVTNAEKVVFTGRKMTKKIYWSHTGYPGGIRAITPEKRMERHPEEIITAAVRGMLPKGPLGRKMLKKLKVYVGGEHPHAAQQPVQLEL